MTQLPNLVGGALCLDFVNTIDVRHAADRGEYLDSYPALVAWSRRAGIIDAGQEERLRAAAAGDPAEPPRVLQRAIALREALYPILSAAARHRPPAAGDLDSLHAELGDAMPHLRISWSARGFTWGWEDARPGLDQMLWPVTWSATDLLVRGPVERIRECPGDDGTCGWLFLDLSKNASRRWCEMRSCGNRAKARRHHARTQTGTPASPQA